MKFPNFLRIASVPFIRVVQINETSVEQKEVLDHFEANLANIISEYLKFSYDTIIPSDREWGVPLPGGNWSGMVGLLQRNEADLIICELSITKARSQVIDYGYPYLIDQLVFVTRPLEMSIDTKSFLKPFSTDVWIYLCAVVIIVPILHLILFQRNSSNGRYQKNYKNILRPSVNAPEKIADYLLRNSWMIFGTLLAWSYAAVLLSFLTFPSLTGVRNIRELANAFRRGESMCTAYPGSYVADELLNSADSDLQSLGQCVKESPGDPDFDVALSRRSSKTLAYIDQESRFIDAEEKYFVSADRFYPDYFAIGMRKGFCCKTQLDYTIHKVWASGIYDKLKKDYDREETQKMLWNPLNKDEGVEQRRLSIGNLEGAFILLGSGYLLATIVLLLEIASKNGITFYLVF